MRTSMIAALMAVGAFTAGKAADTTPLATQDPVVTELRALRATVEQLGQIQGRIAIINVQTTIHALNSSALQQQLSATAPHREEVAKRVAALESASSQPRPNSADLLPNVREGMEIAERLRGEQLTVLRGELSRLQQEEQVLRVAATDAANGLAQAQGQLRELEQLLVASQVRKQGGNRRF